MKTHNNVLLEKSTSFALRIVRMFQYLSQLKREYVLSKQVLRSGTSIGANVNEAQCAQTKNDFYAKLYIAYKETAETEYWLYLLYSGGYIDNRIYHSLWNDCHEILLLLAKITKKSKLN